jgi:DNA-binding CsgD family transcriptional regulator
LSARGHTLRGIALICMPASSQDGAEDSTMPLQISLEDFSTAIAAIHMAAAAPERWPEALSAVARLVNGPQSSSGGDTGWRNPLPALDAGAEDVEAYQACEPEVKRVLALLAPHFRAAKQVQSRLAEALPGRLALASLDRLALAAFVLDGAGAVHHVNAAARSLLGGDGCVRIVRSRFQVADPASNAAFETALRRATQGRPRSSLLPLSQGAKEVYEATVAPLQLGLALVVIARPRPDAERIVERARRLYGLTRAEARVMGALTLGATVDEVALSHGVSTATVRAQVRSIFGKTGVNRQSDLVRLALSGAPLVAGLDR